MGGRGAAARGFVPGGAAEGALRRRGARRGGGGGERGAGAALGWEGEGEKKKRGKRGCPQPCAAGLGRLLPPSPSRGLPAGSGGVLGWGRCEGSGSPSLGERVQGLLGAKVAGSCCGQGRAGWRQEPGRCCWGC